MKLTQDTNLRSDLVKEVIVNAALKLRDRLGYDATIDFLVDAAIPPDVIKRALHGGPVRQREACVPPAPATTCLGDTGGAAQEIATEIPSALIPINAPVLAWIY